MEEGIGKPGPPAPVSAEGLGSRAAKRGPFLIVGLGNPGLDYAWTPHNAGFLAIDRLAERAGNARVDNRRCRSLTATASLAGESIVLAKPETYMNLSGIAIKALAMELGVDTARDLVVIYDELALPFGTVRVRPRGSAGGHNGARSIIAELGTEDWPRVRIGVGPHPEGGREEARRSGKNYLLASMSKGDLAELSNTLDRVAEATEVVIREGVMAAMNRFNAGEGK